MDPVMRQALSVALTAAAVAVMPAGARGQSTCGDHDHEGGLEERDTAARSIRWEDRAYRGHRDRRVAVQLLGFNDFHGQLSPRTVGGRPAGGAAVFAGWLRAAQAGRERSTILVHAGDHVGASPPNSALLQDEPAIQLLNLLANDACRYAEDDEEGWSLGGPDGHRRRDGWRDRYERWLDPRCNVVGVTGNHEFDEGIGELERLLGGGLHPSGPFLEPTWRGARYPTLAANVVDAATGQPVLPPYVVKVVDGVPVAFIGAVLEQTPTIVTPSGVAGLEFLDEADAINAYVPELRRRGIRAIVATLHQGGTQASYTGPTSVTAGAINGPDVLDVLARLDDEIDVVITGHAHGFTNALVKNRNGKELLVTQAFSASTAFADIDLEIDRVTRDVVAKSAAVVTTWGDVGVSPDPEAAALVAAADAEVAPLVNRVVARAQATISRTENAAGESALGDLIADAQRAAVPGAQVAFMNPGGIRADLVALPNGDVTWGAAFTVQPFGNSLVAMDLTGAQVLEVLERQWLGQAFARILKPSGISYTWDAAAPAGSRVVAGSVRVGGAALDLAASYRVVVNSFLAAGGDGFATLAAGTNRVGGAIDLDALVSYVQTLPQPFTAGIEGRITRVD